MTCWRFGSVEDRMSLGDGGLHDGHRDGHRRGHYDLHGDRLHDGEHRWRVVELQVVSICRGAWWSVEKEEVGLS